MSRVLRGADLKLYINNRPFGKVVEIQWSIDEGIYPITTIDTTLPVEFADGPIRVSGSVQVLRLAGDGGLEGSGITVLPHRHELEKYITIHVIDRRTDAVVFQTDRVRVKSQSWRAATKSIMQGSFTFEGIGYLNESYDGE